MKELASLADKGCVSPAIDGLAFPNTPSDWYSSSSPLVSDRDLALSVDFSSGGVVNYNNRYNGFQVRLVRASQ